MLHSIGLSQYAAQNTVILRHNNGCVRCSLQWYSTTYVSIIVITVRCSAQRPVRFAPPLPFSASGISVPENYELTLPYHCILHILLYYILARSICKYYFVTLLSALSAFRNRPPFFRAAFQDAFVNLSSIRAHFPRFPGSSE